MRSGGGERLAMIAALATLAVLVACGQAPPPTWSHLRARLPSMSPSGRASAIAAFVDAHGGTPLVEQDDHLVFLVHEDSDSAPRIVGDINAWAAIPGGVDPDVGVMRRVDGTAWWYLEATAASDARLEYVLLLPDEVRPDPLNPRRVQAVAGPRSEVRMPRWVPQPEVDAAVPEAAGTVTEARVKSKALGRAVRVWYYQPARYDASAATGYPAIYILDGGNYVTYMDVPRVLDRLIAAGAVAPVVAVFVGPDDRLEEYERSQAWLAFMSEELVPTVDARLRTTDEPGQRVVVGSSLGAVGAVRLGLARPDVFGRVAALAPPPVAAGLVEQRGLHERVPDRRWFVLGGRYDSLLDDARRLRQALERAGEPVTYQEVPEGHSAETFRGHLDDALRSLLRGDAERRDH